MVQDTRTEACSLIDKTNHATAHEYVAECCRRCWARLPDDASTALGRLERFDALTPRTCLGLAQWGSCHARDFGLFVGLYVSMSVCMRVRVCVRVCMSAVCMCLGVYV